MLFSVPSPHISAYVRKPPALLETKSAAFVFSVFVLLFFRPNMLCTATDRISNSSCRNLRSAYGRTHSEQSLISPSVHHSIALGKSLQSSRHIPLPQMPVHSFCYLSYRILLIRVHIILKEKICFSLILVCPLYWR